MVTVAFSRSIRSAIGFPTMLLLPTTHMFSVNFNIRNVLTTGSLRPVYRIQSLVLRYNCTNTLRMKTVHIFLWRNCADESLSSSICFGSGSCTKIPFTSSSFIQFLDQLEALLRCLLRKFIGKGTDPQYTRRLFFVIDIHEEAGSFPTWITASATSVPCCF